MPPEEAGVGCGDVTTSVGGGAGGAAEPPPPPIRGDGQTTVAASFGQEGAAESAAANRTLPTEAVREGIVTEPVAPSPSRGWDR